MPYTRQDILDACFAATILGDSATPGDVDAVWRRRAASGQGTLNPEDKLASWQARWIRGRAILDAASLVVSRPFAKDAIAVEIPRSPDSVTIRIEECHGDEPVSRYVALVSKEPVPPGTT